MSTAMPVLYVDAAQLTRRLPMEQAIAAMRAGLGDEVENPLRTRVGQSLVMPGRVKQFTGVKVVGVEPGKPFGVVMVFDNVGQPVGQVEGAALTLLRTGAVTGLATQLLSRANATTLAMLGSGAVAPQQIAGVCAVRPIRTIVLWSRSRPHAKALADQLMPAWPDHEVLVAADADDAASQADIICTATPSHTPLFSRASVRSGTHINAIGAYTADMVEIPADMVRVARVFVEDRTAAAAEAGDLLQAQRTPDGTLSDILAGRLPARRNPDEITLFKSVGVASADIATAIAALLGPETLQR